MKKRSKTAEKASPYWWETSRYKLDVPAPPAGKVDVAIVGAGYAGLAAGLTLARAGRSVAIFDAMDPGEGASSRNGGITSGNIRPGFAELKKKLGEKAALAVEAEGKTAREFLYDFIRSEEIDCDLQQTGAFKGALSFDQYDAQARAAESLSKKLKVDSYAVPYKEQHGFVGSDFYRGGSVRMDIGGVQPAKFVAELLRITVKAGAAVHPRTPVTAIVAEVNGFRLSTQAGDVQANKVLICTNGYTDGVSPWLRRRLIPVRSRMIATEELAPEVMGRLMPRGMMMSENRMMGFYYRPSPDRRRILLGGRDSSLVGDPAAPTLRLRKGLVEIFPELRDVGLSHSWFGNVAMNRDMIPRLFEKDGIVFATGFCGSGVVWAPWLGTRAANRIMGNSKEATSAFDFRPPSFVPAYNGIPYFMPFVIQGYALQDRIAMWRANR